MLTHKLTPIEELEIQAKEKLPKSVYDFIAGGAGSEWGLKNNREAFFRYSIIPRVLRNVTSVNTSLDIFGKTVSCPILIAPCAFHKLVCKDGEIATAKAADKIGTIFTLSTMSSCTIEEVAKASDSLKWFQLYCFKNRALTASLIKRAELSGYNALVLTVDVPAMGMRLRDIKNQFILPANIDAANFRGDKFSSLSEPTDGSKIKEHTDQQFDTGLTWESIDWITSITRLPIILKGILSAEDALEALKHKVSAIIVSNHGGRQIDSVTSSLDVLPDIVDVIQKRIPIFVDGGIRSGEDIFKLMAMGATAVMLGRPVLWSLANGGQDKLVNTFEMLNQEFILTMRLTGCPSLKSIHEKGLTLLSSQDLSVKVLLKELRDKAILNHDADFKPYPHKIFSKL